MKAKPKKGCEKGHSLKKKWTYMTCKYLKHFTYLLTGTCSHVLTCFVRLPVKFHSFLLPILILK